MKRLYTVMLLSLSMLGFALSGCASWQTDDSGSHSESGGHGSHHH